jgi:hypothetical protein
VKKVIISAKIAPALLRRLNAAARRGPPTNKSRLIERGIELALKERGNKS